MKQQPLTLRGNTSVTTIYSTVLTCPHFGSTRLGRSPGIGKAFVLDASPCKSPSQSATLARDIPASITSNASARIKRLPDSLSLADLRLLTLDYSCSVYAFGTDPPLERRRFWWQKPPTRSQIPCHGLSATNRAFRALSAAGDGIVSLHIFALGLLVACVVGFEG